MTTIDESLKQLFQQEFSKMIAVISRLYGLQHIEIAEDIVSETFLTAKEHWARTGLPPNPAAWLYKVAKQKALYHLRRDKIYQENVVPNIRSSESFSFTAPEPDFSEQNIRDSQLKMMFAICHPVIASEAQIGLALRILCGFGIDEIAEAFLSNKETINKRLFRAKEKLRKEAIPLDLPSEREISVRLNNVLQIIYLLFNEGYYSKTQNQVLRKEFCLEALRMALMLCEFEPTNLPQTNALVALICYHTSRFEARQTDGGFFIPYDSQDERLWDQEMIKKGNIYLERAAIGNDLSSYHLEAGIAFWNCQKEDTIEKWENILYHYDLLLQVNYSPVVALNRIYALYKTRGRKEALQEAASLQLNQDHFYFVLLGELVCEIDADKAIGFFGQALNLARTYMEQQYIYNKILAIRQEQNRKISPVRLTTNHV